MNKEIESIVNVTVYRILDATGGWTHSGGLPDFADEVVIRQISYDSSTDKGIYIIQSSLNNGFIGVANSIAGFASSPNTRIQLRTPIPNYISFQLLAPFSPPQPITNCVDDMIAINMDFIKYRK